MKPFSLRQFRTPLVVSALIVLSAFASRSSLVDITRREVPREASLELPASYVLLSPLTRTLDGLSLLSIPQLISVIVVLIAFIVIGTLTAGTMGKRRPIARIATGVGVVVLVMGCLVLAAAMLPRPMASLRVSNPRLVRVDFHSHTSASHDARTGFTADQNRSWHSAGGFDAAYVSDHWGRGARQAFAGAEEAQLKNPPHSGDSMVLLNALEARYGGLFIVTLGMTTADSVLVDREWHLKAGLLQSGRMPVSIAVLPGPLDEVQAVARDGPPHLVGIELVNSAPRALGQLDREDAVIRGRSSSLGLAMVSGSNNHGWGRTVSAWSLLELGDWRSVSPDSLSALIENALRSHGAGAVRVIARVRPRTHGIGLPLTAPVLAAQTLTTLTQAERVVWLVWIWAAGLVWMRIRKRGITAITSGTAQRAA